MNKTLEKIVLFAKEKGIITILILVGSFVGVFGLGIIFSVSVLIGVSEKEINFIGLFIVLFGVLMNVCGFFLDYINREKIEKR